MAVWQSRVRVGTTAVRVDDVETAPNISLIIKNRSSVSIFVGGSNVTNNGTDATDGFELSPGDAISFRTPTKNGPAAWGGLWALAASGSGNRLDRLQISS